eukprot:scaffold1658_cov115-Isochrysis_galbana.AAC.22
MSPSPPHLRQLTESVCPHSVPALRPVTRSHRRMVPSLEAEARRGVSTTWYGSHAMALTHFRCASITLSGKAGSATDQSASRPSLPPDARNFPHGDHATHSTQSRWALRVARGVSVITSHSRTQWSPDPVASTRPSAEKLDDRMASEWPDSVDVHRVTARTRKTAWGT